MGYMSDRDRMVDLIFRKNLFDAAWYGDRYPDVAMLGMDAAYHYRHYGLVMGRAPSQACQGAGCRQALSLPLPPRGGALQQAYHHAVGISDTVGIEYARLHVPDQFSHTIATLHANAALAKGEDAAWLQHINAYLQHFGAAPLLMGQGAGLLDRFATGNLPAVTGGPLVTVIMPAWNAQNTIAAAVRSILGQTWRNLELLIIDDASQDGTWAVMQGLAASDSRIKIRRNAVNVGPYVSKNIMLSMAQGAWITGHDADDWAHPQRIEHHLQAILSRPSPPRVSMSYMIRMDEAGMIDRFGPVSDYCLDGVARLAAIAGTFEAGFLRDHLGSWDNIRFGADSELVARARVLIGDEFAKLPQISMICLNLKDSLTNDSVNGVHPVKGLSQSRQDYVAAYRLWHQALGEEGGAGSKLAFPPPPAQPRPFAAPEAMTVPGEVIRRNLSLNR